MQHKCAANQQEHHFNWVTHLHDPADGLFTALWFRSIWLLHGSTESQARTTKGKSTKILAEDGIWLWVWWKWMRRNWSAREVIDYFKERGANKGSAVAKRTEKAGNLFLFFNFTLNEKQSKIKKMEPSLSLKLKSKKQKSYVSRWLGTLMVTHLYITNPCVLFILWRNEWNNPWGWRLCVKPDVSLWTPSHLLTIMERDEQDTNSFTRRVDSSVEIRIQCTFE